MTDEAAGQDTGSPAPTLAAGKGRPRTDYSALPDLLGAGARAALGDGPAYATEVIRRAIVTGALKPGDMIRQDLMASALSLSKPPVREALRTLEAEQLVIFQQNRGFIVAPESLTEMREAFELRILLEPAVLRAAAPALTAEDLAEARRIMRRLADKPHYLEHFDLNLAFHLTLYRPALRPHFLQTITQAHARTQRYVYARLRAARLIEHAPDDGRHEIMLDRLEAGDVDGACKVLVEHLEEASDQLLKAYLRVFEREERARQRRA